MWKTPAWPVAGSVDTGLGLHSSVLERHGAYVAQLRVASPRIVEALDVVEHVGTGGITGAVDLAGRPFGLHRWEEALHRRVVPDVARPTHAADDVELGEQTLERLALVLAALV